MPTKRDKAGNIKPMNRNNRLILSVKLEKSVNFKSIGDLHHSYNKSIASIKFLAFSIKK